MRIRPSPPKANMARGRVFLFLVLFVVPSYSRGPCDPLEPVYCQLPFPNSFFTREDSESLTGTRVNFSTDTWPRDTLGRSLDLGNWNTMGEWHTYSSAAVTHAWICLHTLTRASGVYGRGWSWVNSLD